MKNIGILLSGRGSNFKAIYTEIETGRIKNASIRAVISNISDAPGLLFAKEKGLNTYFIDPSKFSSRTAHDSEIIDTLKTQNIDLVCLAGYMRILSPQVIDMFENKIINIHPSLLPAFPGLNAQKKAFEYGVKISGCTVHFVDKELDHGPIILQKAVDVKDSDTADTLAERILKQEHKIYPEAVKLFTEDRLFVNKRKVTVDYS